MKIVLIGDSITQGIGKKRINFSTDLANSIGQNPEILNIAVTGYTIRDGVNSLEIIRKQNPDIVIVFLGNVDAQIRPSRNGKLFKKLPNRFKLNNGSMIMPRPFYSRNIIKRLFQYVENALRTFFRKAIYRVDGIEQWVDINEFQTQYEIFIRTLKSYNCNVITCSTIYIDDTFFPGTQKQYLKYNDVISKICKNEEAEYVDLFFEFKKNVIEKGWDYCYCKDHFHPNQNGNIIIAELLANSIKIGDSIHEQ